jgi:hypothetical protein
MVLDIDTQNGDTQPLHTWPGSQRYTEHFGRDRGQLAATPVIHLGLTTHNPRSKEDPTLHNATSTLEGCLGGQDSGRVGVMEIPSPVACSGSDGCTDPWGAVP